jgi:hypothetical protein
MPVNPEFHEIGFPDVRAVAAAVITAAFTVLTVVLCNQNK